MLILTRRVGESIVVGDDIVLTVFEVRGDAVRVGIEAPRSVQVHRQEVYDELKRQNEQAVSPSDDAVIALAGALDGHPAPQSGPAPAAPLPPRPGEPGRPGDLARPGEPGPPRLVPDPPAGGPRAAKPAARSRTGKTAPPAQ